eukprot:573707_1
MTNMAQARRLLRAHVCNAQSINGILPLLQLIPFNAIRDAALQAIRDLDTNTINEIQYKCLPITAILPDDITQHILSFSDSLNMKYISKTFNNCYSKNKALELKRR